MLLPGSSFPTEPTFERRRSGSRLIAALVSVSP